MEPGMHLVVPCLILLSLLALNVRAVNKTPTPNVVLIMADDLGYGDLGCFGNTTVRTPHLDKLASQGVKLTHNMAAATVCTPSRAAFLTGRYAIRSGMIAQKAIRVFPFTASAGGLPASELTIGKVAKTAGYRTAFLGKWHLGWSVDRSDPDHTHPLNRGFDYFYGVPLSMMPDFNDWGEPIILHFLPNLPLQLVFTFVAVLISIFGLVRARFLHLYLGLFIVFVASLGCGTVLFVVYNLKLLNSFMFRNYDMVEQPIHLPSVTRKLVKESEEFLGACHADHAPFLLLISWLHVNSGPPTAPEFRGRSLHGPYGDAVEEMDWGVGQVMDVLERLGLADNTMVYFTSDHGAESTAKDLLGRTVGGSNSPLSGGKGDGSTEGSFRVPGIVRWPGHFPAGGVVNEPVSLMDVLPTLAELLHVGLDNDVTAVHVIDGVSLVPLLRGEGKVSPPHEFLFHYCRDSVHAVTYRPRSGNGVWKLLLREPRYTAPDVCTVAIPLDPPQLYDLTADPTAAKPLRAEDHAQFVSTIMEGLKQHQDSVQEMPCQLAWWRLLWQPWKQPCCDFPRCACEDEKFKGLFS